ncbi:MAG: hypothetical protein KFW07_02840, partial [Mycoplasmataceae bacterium]|nr:hypothetical protein [Mycoplasmataceae bacterium]
LIAFGDAKIFKYRFENFFNDPNINYVIHYNKRNYPEFKKLKELEIFKQNNVYLFSEVEVFWGDVSILDAMLSCIEKTNEIFGDYDHLIMLDGKSLPCRSWHYIINKITTFEGNWFNYNQQKYPKRFYFWQFFKKQEFHSYLFSGLDRPSDSKKGTSWLGKLAKSNFRLNIRKEKPKSFFKWLFLHINNDLFFSIFNRKNMKYLDYYFSESVKVSEINLKSVNIIGPSIILSKDRVDKILKYDLSKGEYKKLAYKQAPEELYLKSVYESTSPDYKNEESKNAFLMLSWQALIMWKINKKYFRKFLIKNDDLLFLRRFEKIKQMKRFKKHIFTK